MENKVNITFSDNTRVSVNKGITFYEMLKNNDKNDILAVRIDNEVYPLTKKILKDCKVELVEANDLIGNKIYKSALKYIFIEALSEIFPDMEVIFDHSVPKGMLVSLKGNVITADDLDKLKNKMFEIVKEDLVFEKLNVQPKEAIKYYKSIKNYEKADNIQNINDRVVTLYKLKDKLNYFYSEMPYSTGCINKFDLVYLGNNRIIFLFPTVGGDLTVPEYVHYDDIISSFKDGKNWLNNMNMRYITDLNKTISNGNIKNFIEGSELMYSMKLASIANTIINNRDIKFVLIAGPSSSGKTTSTRRLASYFSAMGYDPIKISVDDYFINRDDTPLDEFGNPDFECLEAIDVNLFNTHLNQLLNKEQVSIPKYNFITGKREETKKYIKINEKSIILIEGLHALNDDLTKQVDKKYKYKIYLSPFIPLSIDRHNYISTLDTRLIRRIIRDNRTRGYDVVKTIDHWQSVRRGEEKYIFPYIHQANAIINTSLAYEIGVTKVFVEPLLYSVGVDSIYYEEARRIISFLKQFYPIPGEYVTDDSILREFIGGKYND